jgi:hypothetical protein
MCLWKRINPPRLFLNLLVKTFRDASFQRQLRALTIILLQLQDALHLIDSIASYS